MSTLLLIWLALAFSLIALVGKRAREGGALTLAYFFALSLIHVPGALAYLDPGSSPLPYEETLLGFEVTLLGMTAFLAGIAAEKWVWKRSAAAARAEHPIDINNVAHMSRRFIVLGAFVFFAVLPVAALVPTLTSIVAPLAGLLIIGIWLHIYGAAISGNTGSLLATFLIFPLLPLITLAVGGFVGAGIHWILSAITFLFVVLRRRKWVIALSPLVAYLGLSFFVAYMGERAAIREALWQQQTDIMDRLNRIGAIFTNFELLNLANETHTSALDARLNQNIFVGAAVERHRAGLFELAYGNTIPWWAIVPRAIWAEKPDIGGGGELVAEYTGMSFSAGTSVGSGQVLEFYVNFGWVGIVIGFVGYGFLLMRLDRGTMHALAEGDVGGLLFRALPGLTLLNAGNNLVELIVGAFAALIAAYLVMLVERHRLNRLRTAAEAARA